MGFKRKWKPNKTQARQFAKNMQDSEFASAYYNRKEERANKRRATSKFDYAIAGGEYIPTQHQYENSIKYLLEANLTPEQKTACDMVVFGYVNQEKIHHDYIHVVNDMIRKFFIN